MSRASNTARIVPLPEQGNRRERPRRPCGAGAFLYCAWEQTATGDISAGLYRFLPCAWEQPPAPLPGGSRKNVPPCAWKQTARDISGERFRVSPPAARIRRDWCWMMIPFVVSPPADGNRRGPPARVPRAPASPLYGGEQARRTGRITPRQSPTSVRRGTGYIPGDAAQDVKLSPVRRETGLQSCGFIRLRRLPREKSRTRALPRIGRLPGGGGVAPADRENGMGRTAGSALPTPPDGTRLWKPLLRRFLPFGLPSATSF